MGRALGREDDGAIPSRYTGGLSGWSIRPVPRRVCRSLPAEFGLPTNTNWREINKHYAFDGDWFAVEYLFQAEDKKTSQLQREGTLFFGRVKDDRLIVAIEYFDRLVKGFQHVGALPPFREDEMPFPWPDYDGLTRKYRP